MKMVKWIIIGLVVLGGGAYAGWRVYKTTRPPDYETYTVRRGVVLQEVAETGKVVAPEELDLYFKNGGRVQTVYVKEGETVVIGQPLAQLDIADLVIKEREAAAALSSAQAKYDQALAGTASVDLTVYETAVRNAQNNLEQVHKTSAEDVAVTETAQKNAYAALKTTLRVNIVTVSSALTDIDNILGVDNTIGNDAFEINLSTLDVKAKSSAEDAYREAKSAKVEAAAAVDALVGENSFAQTLASTPQVLNALNKTIFALEKTKLVLDNSTTGTNFSATDLSNKKTAIDTARSAVATGITNLTNAKSAVDTAESNLLSAQTKEFAAIVAAEGALQTAQDQLAAKKAPLRAVDKAVYEAAVAQARANFELIRQQIADAAIKAPIAGIIATVDLKSGELATTLTRVLSLISNDLQIEADVSELDISKISAGSSLTATFEALGSQEFTGRVLTIAPREKLKDEDIFYKVTMVLNETAPVKPGMTAEVAIQVGEKSEVLIIPERWVIKRAGKTYVKVLRDGVVQEVEIFIGLRGEDVAEVTQGLNEGDQIVNPAVL